MKIHQLKLSVSNSYLIEGERPILVDTGTAKDAETIRSKLRELRVELSDLSLIVHTHVHSDHMGSTDEIVALAKCPIAYHPADQPLVDQSHNGSLNGIGLRGKIMSRFFSGSKFKAVNSDIELHNDMNLTKYGSDVTVIETPGHTPGSISIVTPNGDAIVGDVIMGGYLGGNLMSTKPNFHYFADDLSQVMSSLDLILSRSNRKLYVGHGGPLQCTTVRNWRQRQMR